MQIHALNILSLFLFLQIFREINLIVKCIEFSENLLISRNIVKENLE